MNNAWNLIGEGLKLLAGLLEHEAPEARAVAKSIVNTLSRAHAGGLSVAELDAAITELRDAIAADDLELLAAAALKFGGK